MYIQIGNDVIEFDNSSKSFIQLFDQINDILDKKGFNMTGIKVDGQSIEEPIKFIDENFNTIKNLEVIAVGTSDLVIEVLSSANQYINNAIPLISRLSEEFYQLPNDTSWNEIGNLLEGVQWIIETATQIDSIKDLNKIVNYEIWNEYVKAISKIINIIPEFETSIENKDTVLIGDILSYEIIPAFEEMSNKLGFLIPGVDKKC